MRTRPLMIILFAHFLMASTFLAQESGLTLVDFLYEITDDFDTSQTATVGFTTQKVIVDLTNPTIPVYTDGTDIIGGSVFLHDSEGNVVASDMLRTALRSKLIFSHENTVRADVVGHFYFNNIEDDLWVEIYQDIENHPNFEQALALRQTLPPFGTFTFNDYSEYFSLTGEMGRDLLEKFLDFDLSHP